MTIISCNINKSGGVAPLTGFIRVTSNSYLTDAGVFYAAVSVDYPLVGGMVDFDLVPTELSKTAYTFSIFETVSLQPDTEVYKFEAIVPTSATPISFTTLAPQSGLRYDRRDASLLTLARFLTSNSNFINFLGNELWSNKGTWDPTTIYRRGDVVLRLGSSYQYVSTQQLSGLAPELNPTVWSLLVQAGVGGGGTALPFGSMLLYPSGATVPAGFLRCDGSAVSRTTYSNLFVAIGTAYGVGNGTTTFNIPDQPITGSSSFIVYTGV
jgi:hypothetical protein